MRVRETFSATGLLVMLAVACLPQSKEPQLPSYCYDENLLKAKYATCVKNAETRSESDSCADHVDATCGFTVTRTKAKR